MSSMPAVAVAHCPHCGTAVEGTEDAYCCGGCRAAAEIIRGAGLERYYAERVALPDRPAGQVFDWSSVPTVLNEDGTRSVRLAVDGLKCASCVWVTEKVLEGTPGVSEAHLSYGTGRATLRWDPASTSLDVLAGRITALGYRPRLLGQAATHDRDLLVRLGVSAFLAANVMLAAASLYTGWIDGMEAAYAAMFRWLGLGLSAPIALWCALPFYRGAVGGLRHGVLHMDLPVSLGVVLMFGHGVWATVVGADGFLDSMAMLVTLLLAGRVIESRGRHSASEAATALAAKVPRTARRDGVNVPVEALVPGDLVDVGPGVEVPADGLVHSGHAEVQMSLLTGESEPVALGPGARVVAGAVVLSGQVRVQVEQTGSDTLLAQMAEQLEIAADRRTEPTAADRIAPWFTAATLILAAATFAWWLPTGLETAIAVTVSVLVVACPCALALSQPLAAAAGLGSAARRGLLMRSAQDLLALGEIDTVALDKTGTLTEGQPEVIDADDAVLRVAAGLERYSTHPLARAILAETIRRGIPLPEVEQVLEEPGVGVSGVVDGRAYTLRAGGAGRLEIEGLGTITLRDRLRPDSAELVRHLRDRGLRVVLLTGDHEQVALDIARQAGIHDVHAQVGPEGKRQWVLGEQARGHRVAFIGDGLNDGPGLAAATVGIAMGGGAASSVLAADGALTGTVTSLEAGRVASTVAARAIRGNLQRSVVYNVVAVTAAMLGLVNPLVAAVSMPASSLLVVLGASLVERGVAREMR